VSEDDDVKAAAEASEQDQDQDGAEGTDEATDGAQVDEAAGE
jgi:hypothetical protein